MGSQELIRKLFSRESIVEIMARLPNLKSPALDLLYPEANRVNHPLPVISYKDMQPRSGNIPLVKRGSQSYQIAEGSAFSSIEPQPVNPSSFLDAVDMSNLLAFEGKAGGGDLQQNLIANRIDTLRRISRDTAQALAIQSVSGQLSYDLRGGGGEILKYGIEFGTPATVACSTLFDATSAKQGHLIAQLAALKAQLESQGFGNDVVFLAPADVYAAIINLYPSNWRPEFDSEGFLVVAPGLKISLFSFKYYDYTTKASVGIAAKTLVAWDRGAGSTLIYAAVDDIDANFVASPFWSKAVKSDDPSGYKIIGQSKPLPVPNVKGIAKSVVIA